MHRFPRNIALKKAHKDPYVCFREMIVHITKQKTNCVFLKRNQQRHKHTVTRQREERWEVFKRAVGQQKELVSVSTA